MNGFVDESDGRPVVLHGRPLDVGKFVDAIDRHLAVLDLIKQRCVRECDVEFVHFPMVR